MNAEEMAERLSAAFASGKLQSLEPLLHPKVRWGNDEETPDTCHSKGDVLSWYARAQRAGITATVTDSVVRDQAVVLALQVSGREPIVLHQVFRLQDGLVRDIRGYPELDTAIATADKPLDSQVS